MLRTLTVRTKEDVMIRPYTPIYGRPFRARFSRGLATRMHGFGRKKADNTEHERVHLFLHWAREHGITRTRHAQYTAHTHNGLCIRALQAMLLVHPVPVQ